MLGTLKIIIVIIYHSSWKETMVHPKKIYWVVIADGAEARIFKREGRYAPLQEVTHLTHEHELTHEHGPDRPGRVFESAIAKRHAYEPKSDWHDRQKEVFIKELAGHINQAHQNQEFERLVLVCPSQLIGLLKENVISRIAEENVQTVGKDLTKHAAHDVQKLLDDIV